MELTKEQLKVLERLTIDSGKKGNLPNAAILIKGRKIIGKSGSYVASKKDATAHAERLVIEKVCKKEKRFLLPEYSLVTVFEPCLMCFGAAYWVGIKKVYYIIPAKKYIKEIPWCGESKKLNKDKLTRKLAEPFRIIHLKKYMKEFTKIFDDYADKVKKLKR